jgi:hypothetical protein
MITLVWLVGTDFAAGLDSGAIRQADVHHHHIRCLAGRDLYGLSHVSGLADDRHPLAPVEKGLEPFSHDLMVIDEHYTNQRLRHSILIPRF